MEELETQIVHLRDDLQKIIGLVNRVVESELTMLDLACTAIEKGKDHIATDHIIRAQTELRKLLRG